jgi:hypothetical protein
MFKHFSNTFTSGTPNKAASKQTAGHSRCRVLEPHTVFGLGLIANEMAGEPARRSPDPPKAFAKDVRPFP